MIATQACCSTFCARAVVSCSSHYKMHLIAITFLCCCSLANGLGLQSSMYASVLTQQLKYYSIMCHFVPLLVMLHVHAVVLDLLGDVLESG